VHGSEQVQSSASTSTAATSFSSPKPKRATPRWSQRYHGRVG
jgi:hypothetical protein